jgi:hypothetical protein
VLTPGQQIGVVELSAEKGAILGELLVQRKSREH